MSIGYKLAGSFGIVIALTLLMYGFSSWGNGSIRQAHKQTLDAMTQAHEAEQQSTELESMLGQIRDTRTGLDSAIGRMRDNMLRNQSTLQLFDENSADMLAEFLQNGGIILAERFNMEPDWLASLQTSHQSMLQTAAKVSETWQPRHEGLSESLDSLKRTLLNWTLKVANMMFVQSSIGELLSEELGDTPIEEFKQSDLYKAHVNHLPELREAFEKISPSNEKLFNWTNELDTLTLYGQWEEARLFYRDHFPPTVKSIMVDIDLVVDNEKDILLSQKQATLLLNNELLPYLESILNQLDVAENRLLDLRNSNDQAVAEATNMVLGSSKNVDARISRIDHINLLIIAAVVVLGALITLLATRSTTRPLKRILGMVTALEEGEVSTRLNMKQHDELGKVGRALDSFADNLQHEILTAFDKLAEGDFTFEAQGLIRSPLARANSSLTELITLLQMSGEQIASGAGQIADSSQALSQGATESASSLEEISASLNQLSSQTGTNAENANTANQLSAEARNAAEQGSRKMQDMVAAMTEINEAGQSISKIIKVIDEIAFQTNLLALNAAVEAARAGQHGKGFAVVAEEVRNLAARSAKAAAETSELIEGSVQKTANGTTIADQTAEALQSIVSGIGKVTDLVAEIAAASSEQAQGVSQINQGISQISQVTQQNTASAEESAAASEELSSQAAQMREMLMRFTLKQGSSAHSNVRAVPQKSAAAKSSGWGESSAQPPKKIAAKKPIALDDDEFGKY